MVTEVNWDLAWVRRQSRPLIHGRQFVSDEDGDGPTHNLDMGAEQRWLAELAPSSQQKTFGVLFGSFDPIHNNHIDIAKFALYGVEGVCQLPG